MNEISSKLWNRNFSMVVIGQIISLFGNAILRFALSLYVLDITGSAAAFGTITAASMIPIVLFSPIGGMLADRVNRRNIMAALDFITAALVFGFSFFITGIHGIPVIAVLMIALSVIQSIYTPSVQSSVPLLQREENIAKGNAFVNQVNMLANLLGPVLAGIIYGFAGAMPVILISAVCFLLSAVLELFIHIPFYKSRKKERIIEMVKGDFKESFRYISKEQPAILKVVGLIAMFNLFLVSLVTIGMPYIINVVLNMRAEYLGGAQGAMAAAGLSDFGSMHDDTSGCGLYFFDPPDVSGADEHTGTFTGKDHFFHCNHQCLFPAGWPGGIRDIV